MWPVSSSVTALPQDICVLRFQNVYTPTCFGISGQCIYTGWECPCPNTTDVYARADVGMLKAALEKASQANDVAEEPIWQDNEELILKLCGLE